MGLSIEKGSLTTYLSYLKPRPRDWHKGLSGHVLVVGGEAGFSGAPCMAALAALRTGAGLLTVATKVEHAAIINAAHPELMCRGIVKATDLDPWIAKAQVIVLGPGLGQTAWSKEMWAYVIRQNKPLVVDADGLNFLAHASITNENWVLTPHPGEAARLLKKSKAVIQQDRIAAVQAIQKQFGGTVVLKGAGTLVYSPLNASPMLCEEGNPGMASAGMGDILSGVIGGFIAQGIPLPEAAKLAVLIHAMAGDFAAKEGERGMIATDMLPYLRKLSNP